MAKLTAAFGFTGSLQGVTAYTRKDLPGRIILRTKGGASKKTVQTDPAFASTRRINKEFGGCSTTGKWVRRVLHPLRPIVDHNPSGPINALMMAVQRLDTDSSYGKRHVLLSRSPQLLEGFNLNQKFSFDATMRGSLSCSLSKEQLSASIGVAALLPGINFFPPSPYPFYRLSAVLGIVPDHFYGQPLYKPLGDYSQCFSKVVHSQWLSVKSKAPAFTLELVLASRPQNNAFSLLLAVGIELGSIGAAAEVEAVRHVGCGKIVAVR